MAMRSINPHRPSEVVMEFEPGGPEGVKAAVAAARKAFNEWSSLSAAVRGKALDAVALELERRADEIVDLQVKEIGKPLTEARSETERGIAIFRYYAQMVLAPDGETYPSQDGRAWLMARRFPLGVCALITPWNFPVAIQAWKSAPALGFGNTIVLKPAPESAAVATLLHEITSKHLLEGAFQLVYGDKETGEPLVDHPDVAAVSFTGSVAAGSTVAARAAARGARVQCEMGGQNPSVVLSDADLDFAAHTVASAAMGYAGQKCTATSRVIVEAPVYKQFRDLLVSVVESMDLVDPSRESCQVGPVISEGARGSALQAIERGGGRMLTGGRPLAEEGFYLAPTLIELSDHTSVLVKQEVFAPVAAVMQAKDAHEAVSVANEVKHGLCAALFTTDLERATDLLPQIEAGLVRTNAPTTGVEYHAPFGGIKGSSIGPREQGPAARDFYTESRTLLLSPGPSRPRPGKGRG
jgi:alpha-ketoglutaric semialdehyde dehydrogenase